MMYERSLIINGFPVTARYTAQTCRDVFMPLAGKIRALLKPGHAITVFIAAPPGAGKSVFAAALSGILRDGGTNAIALGLDGFHHTNAYLESHFLPDGRPLRAIKGAPETYDIAKLARALAGLECGVCDWPVYDRRLHDVSAERIRARGDVFIVEGNWLLLDEGPWAELRGFCDMSIAISADEQMLLPRLVARKMRGGMDEAAARTFCMDSDLANVRRFREHSFDADVVLAESEDDNGVVQLMAVSGLRGYGAASDGFTIC